MTFKSILKILKKVDYFFIGLVLFFFYIVFVALGKIIFELVNWRNKTKKESFWIEVNDKSLYQLRSSY